MAAIVVIGCFLAVARTPWGLYLLVVVSHSPFAWAFVSAAAAALSRNLGAPSRGNPRRTEVGGLLACCLSALLYAGWAHHRAIHASMWLDRRFPYPDPAILAYERWLDARRPVEGDVIKLHGEFPTVTFALGLLGLLLAGVSGFLAGLLLPWPEPATNPDGEPEGPGAAVSGADVQRGVG
jgi:hypothetical protein